MSSKKAGSRYTTKTISSHFEAAIISPDEYDTILVVPPDESAGYMISVRRDYNMGA